MPYFVTAQGEVDGCAGYAVVKEDGEAIGCHTSREDAISQMVAVSLAEGIEPGGQYMQRQLPDNFRPALEDDVPEGRACGNCLFYDESNIQGDRAFCERWEEYVRGDYYCNAWQSKDDRAASSGERMTMDNVEIRTFDAAICEMRATEDGDGMTFGGYAWRYMEPSLPLPFTERIAPGAFTRTLKSKNDIRAYVNHDDTRLLGSTRAKTLKIEDRAEGGWVELSLPPTTDGEMVRALVSRGDIQGMSFGFSTVRDSWSEDGSERTLEEVRLHEVSVVTGVPAYPSTSASVRNLRVIAKRTDTDVDQLAEAISALEAGQISDDQADILRKVVDRAAGIDEPQASDSTPISLLMKQLDLLGKTL